MKKLSKKLSLCYKTVLKGGILDTLNNDSFKDPINQLLNKKEEVEIILKSRKVNLFKFLYFNWKNIHDKLYKEDYVIDLDDDKYNTSFTLSDLFYIDLIIMNYEETREFYYSLKLIEKLNEKQKRFKENDTYRKLIYAKIIIDLINHIYDVDDLDQETLNDIKASNEEIMKNSLNSIKINFQGIDNYFSDEKKYKIDEIYSFILESLIKNNKFFESYDNISSILDQLDFKNIDLTNTMLENLKETLDSDIKKYGNFSESKDYGENAKINFYFVLYEYIFKNSFYIYQFNFSKSLRENIIRLLKKEKKNILKNSVDKDKVISIINIYTGSEYFYEKYINELEFKDIFKDFCLELDYKRNINEKINNFKNKFQGKNFNKIINFKLHDNFHNFKKEIDELIPNLKLDFLFYKNLIIKFETKINEENKITWFLSLYTWDFEKNEKKELKSFCLKNVLERGLYKTQGFLYFMKYINKKYNKSSLLSDSSSILNETTFYRCRFYKFNKIKNFLSEENNYDILTLEKKIYQHKLPIETILEINNCYLSFDLENNIYIYNNNFEKIDYDVLPMNVLDNNFVTTDQYIIVPSNKGVYLLKFNQEQSNSISIAQINSEPSTVFLVMDKNMILGNKKCIKILSSLTQEIASIEADIICGIKIWKNKAIFLSNSLSNKSNEILSYDSLNEYITKVKLGHNYSFFSSRNNLVLMPNEKGIKIFLLCGCKNKDENENGILVINLLLSKDIFVPTYNFEAYCFCPIFINTKTKEGVTKNYYTYYFLAGGFDIEKKRGAIKLFKLITEDENNLKGIESTQEIFENNFFFKDKINCIIQSKKTGKILISCMDRNVYLVSEPNISMYLREDEEKKQESLKKKKIF